MSDNIFTIGHSTHPQDRFVSLLRQHGVTALCDVRSAPYSRINPQFNREALKQTLHQQGIAYHFMGRELGARSEDPACYEDGKVQYDRLALTDLFQDGLNRVQQQSSECRVALMCAEKEPLECHRTILVARHLVDRGFELQHIHADGRLEPHFAAMNRLVRMLSLPENDMFYSRAEIFVEAYRCQAQRIAYDSRSSARPDAAATSGAGG